MEQPKTLKEIMQHIKRLGIDEVVFETNGQQEILNLDQKIMEEEDSCEEGLPDGDVEDWK